jgi:hypothetical protein
MERRDCTGRGKVVAGLSWLYTLLAEELAVDLLRINGKIVEDGDCGYGQWDVLYYRR